MVKALVGFSVSRVLLALLTLSLLANGWAVWRFGHPGTARTSGSTNQPGPSAVAPAGGKTDLDAAVEALLRLDRPAGFYENIARILETEGENAAAARLMEKAVAGTKEPFAQARLLGELGKLQVKAGQTKPALESYAKAIAASPEKQQKVSLASTLGRLNEQYGTPAEALRWHEYVVQNAQQDWVKDISRKAILRMKEQLGQLPQVLDDLQRRAEADPKDAAALETLVEAYHRQKNDLKAAISWQEKLAAAQPDNPKRVRDLVDLCLEAKDLDKAEAVLRKGLESEAGRSAGFQPASSGPESDGAAGGGRAGFQPAPAEGTAGFQPASAPRSAGFQPASSGPDPEGTRAGYYLEHLSRVSAMKGDDAQAQQWAYKLAESKPDDPITLAQAASLLAYAKAPEKGLELVEKAIALARSDEERAHLYLNAAGLADQMKDWSRAERYYKRISELKSAPAIIQERAVAGLKMVKDKRAAGEGPK